MQWRWSCCVPLEQGAVRLRPAYGLMLVRAPGRFAARPHAARPGVRVARPRDAEGGPVERPAAAGCARSRVKRDGVMESALSELRSGLQAEYNERLSRAEPSRAEPSHSPRVRRPAGGPARRPRRLRADAERRRLRDHLLGHLDGGNRKRHCTPRSCQPCRPWPDHRQSCTRPIHIRRHEPFGNDSPRRPANSIRCCCRRRPEPHPVVPVSRYFRPEARAGSGREEAPSDDPGRQPNFYGWSDHGPSWSENDTVAVRLVALQPPSAPGNLTARPGRRRGSRSPEARRRPAAHPSRATRSRSRSTAARAGAIWWRTRARRARRIATRG